jgi:hypothetical protein
MLLREHHVCIICCLTTGYVPALSGRATMNFLADAIAVFVLTESQKDSA